jgi:diadenosine tetraphosphate (Ap4A) HIT family hydrolase
MHTSPRRMQREFAERTFACGNVNPMLACPFCQPQEMIVAENEVALAIADKHPISLGHCLVIPRRHVSSIFDLPSEEYMGYLQLVRTLKNLLSARHSPAGFNLAVNDGKAAGQTVEHAHIHLVPRYEGDLLNPSDLRMKLPGLRST